MDHVEEILVLTWRSEDMRAQLLNQERLRIRAPRWAFLNCSLLAFVFELPANAKGAGVDVC